MLDSDSLLMKRVFELARRGAGLVSPNPLVGAVLVNDGRVVGEGYHRYDRLKHAESYAIEMAGTQARGSTLYCNLEPCCHHGRTPPCTDALIEAGISRAVIAIKDPDRRVNGRGIEQLRQAGIDAEVGLLEERALRLNETYLKFITTGLPFVHGVIEYSSSESQSAFEWRPSREFLLEVAEYDAVLIGDRPGVNKVVVETAVAHEHHRPPVVVAGESEPGLIKDLRRREARKLSVVTIETGRPEVEANRRVIRLDEGTARSELGSVLAMLARIQVTSVLALPGLVDLTDVSNFEELDKLTLVVPGSMNDQGVPNQWVLGNLEFGLDRVGVSEIDGLIEVTGYPSLRGVA